MDLENIVFNIIVHAGDAKSSCFEALNAARNGNFTEADNFLQKAKYELLKGHHVQSNMLQQEAAGNKQEITLLLVHAEDHLMGAQLTKDLIEQMVKLYKEIKGVETGE